MTNSTSSADTIPLPPSDGTQPQTNAGTHVPETMTNITSSPGQVTTPVPSQNAAVLQNAITNTKTPEEIINFAKYKYYQYSSWIVEGTSTSPIGDVDVVLTVKDCFKAPDRRRAEISYKGGPMTGQKSLKVFTGVIFWDEETAAAYRLVTKTSLPPRSTWPGFLLDDLDVMHEPMTWRFIGSNKLQNEPVWILEGTPTKEHLQSKPGVPIAKTRAYVGQRDGFVYKTERIAEDGEVEPTWDLKKLVLNPNLPDSLFSYTPPEGVPVTELPPPK